METQAQLNDPYYRMKRREAWRRDAEPFFWQLNYLHARMPPAPYKLDLTTGEFSKCEADPEWQAEVDKVLKTMNDYLTEKYPDLYARDTNS